MDEAAGPDGAERRFVFRGRCGLCGGPDARHRLVDAWVERVAAGESVEGTADEFGVPVAWVEVACVAAGVATEQPQRRVWSDNELDVIDGLLERTPAFDVASGSDAAPLAGR